MISLYSSDVGRTLLMVKKHTHTHGSARTTNREIVVESSVTPSSRTNRWLVNTVLSSFEHSVACFDSVELCCYYVSTIHMWISYTELDSHLQKLVVALTTAVVFSKASFIYISCL